jgi:16S rRNA (cytosine967-C5)-methyltransferase
MSDIEKQKPARADGLAARRFASEVIEDVVRRRLALDERLEQLAKIDAYKALSPSDRGLVRAIATAALRRLGTIRKILSERMPKGIPPKSGRLEAYLIASCAQIIALETPAHAAVDTCVTLVREDKHAKHFADLANAVMRRISTERAEIALEVDTLRDDTPGWLADRWVAAYGKENAEAIARAHASEPSVDISVKSDPSGWAERLGAAQLPTGSLRLTARTAIPQLPGFEEGEWWVQDAAAAIPARLLKAKAGQTILDLCAAPGGKTAQLAQTGATVVAVDRSAARMVRLRDNMARLKFNVETIVSEAAAYETGGYDGVLLDAPCSATGTIRRHPDVAWSKTLQDVYKLAAVQARLLDHAATLVKPGGRLVYATCSLERDEGEVQIKRFLERNAGFKREAVQPKELAGIENFITDEGDIRCLPCHWPDPVDRVAGLDGFFASRLVRTSE